MSRHLTLYLGFDGAYVLSRYPLKTFKDNDSGGPFLATGRKFSCHDLQPSEAATIGLTSLKLKKFDVVKIKIEATKPRPRKRKARPKYQVPVSAKTFKAMKAYAEAKRMSMRQVVEEACR